MPIYEYECVGCGDRHEFIQKFSDPPKRKCPACGKSKLKKLISAAAFHLKGDGWYVTDFKDGGKKKPDAKAKDADTGKSAADASSASSDAKKSDSKTESSSGDSGKKKSKTKGGPSKAA
ncbi:FmdB family zinc ribbon protein [Thioalkalivibrio sp. HK1]|uniref:FmdB family zinc ribbon protein n=1 Tax=Thioalkalivibrio sp. HK1 TaxID=1469245 RepID=UPI00046E7DBE|nr:zinc ribbon domain-containing protein [Thioalkalivibrio sp. HK1]